jgi:hypothetical protein
MNSMVEFNAAGLAKGLMKLPASDLRIVCVLLCLTHFENAFAARRTASKAANTHRMLNRSHSQPELTNRFTK